MTRKVKTTGLTLLLGGSIFLSLQAQSLEHLFKTPPQEARPRVWWHWMNGNITEDGIYKDLLWMNRAGIGGVHNFDANLQTTQVVTKRIDYMSPTWQNVFRKAVYWADSLNMEFTIASAPGWSATGGPWVQKQDGMKKLTWREMTIHGSAHNKEIQIIKLPELYTQTGVFQDVSLPHNSPHAYAQQIAVLAVKRPSADKTMAELKATLTTSGGSGLTIEALTDGRLSNDALLYATNDGSMGWIQYEFSEPQTFKAVSLMTGSRRSEWGVAPAPTMARLMVSNDGEHFLCAAVIPQCFVPLSTIAIPPTTARYWRIYIENPKPDRRLSVHSRYTQVPEFRLYTNPRVNHAEEKAGFAAAWDMFKFETPQCQTNEVLNLSQIVDLTDQVDSIGQLSWRVPEGDWTILRFGWSLTGKENHPASPEATGLEVDKLDPVAFPAYLRTYLNNYKDASNGLMGQRGIQYVLTDSYEAQQETWTPSMQEQFERRRGYKLLPWLPALTGQIINSTAETERFLFDWRQTLSELFTENYDRITTIAQDEFGMKGRYTESHENGRLFIGDGMDIKRSSQIPMSALWCSGRVTTGNSTRMMAEADIRESASVAHIYGQNLVAAESMTVTGALMTAYTYHPGNLKKYLDTEFACGLNRVIVHTSVHQPVDSLRPGLGLMVFGQWFTRHETWAEQARAWTDYMARTSFLLQQGHFVADVLYYYGEDNNITGLFGETGTANVPQGYAYDFCSPHALINEVFAEGSVLKTHSGMQYRVLALDPNVRTMSLPVLRKIAQLAHAGVTICGSLPERPSGRNDATDEWKQLVNDIWYQGLKNVTNGVNLIDILEQDGLKPDVEISGGEYLNLPYVHRSTSEQEIYWIKNPTPLAFTSEITLRTQGKKPELWHPETGQTEELSYQLTADGRTLVSVPLVGDDAVFVVFQHPTDKTSYQLSAFEEQTLLTISTPWSVSFQEGQGAPKGNFTFSNLQSLSQHSNPGIRFFSGKTTYKNQIQLKYKDLGSSLYIDLGKVCDLAEVFVNGQSMGTVWKSPYRCDISSALHAGNNQIEIHVVNVWRNRIIGDLQPDSPNSITHIAFPGLVRADMPLLESGLIGPVRIISEIRPSNNKQ